MVLVFEPTTFETGVSSHNLQTRAPAPSSETYLLQSYLDIWRNSYLQNVIFHVGVHLNVKPILFYFFNRYFNIINS